MNIERDDGLQDPGGFLGTLEDVIRGRLREGGSESYIARLLEGGSRRLAQKVGEEAVELALAAVAGDRGEQLEEAADLLFHMLVLLNSREIRLREVVTVLERRHRERTDRA